MTISNGYVCKPSVHYVLKYEEYGKHQTLLLGHLQSCSGPNTSQWQWAQYRPQLCNIQWQDTRRGSTKAAWFLCSATGVQHLVLFFHRKWNIISFAADWPRGIQSPSGEVRGLPQHVLSQNDPHNALMILM